MNTIWKVTLPLVATGALCGWHPAALAAEPEPEAGAAEVAELSAKLGGNILHGRRAAVEYLGRMGAQASAAAPALVRAMTTDEDLTVRLRAAWALGEIGEPTDVVVPGLIAALNDAEPAVRINATKSLVELRDASRDALAAAIAADVTPDLVRAGCVDALTAAGEGAADQEIVASLRRLASSDDAWARTTTALVTGRLDPKSIVALQPAMAKLINDPEANVQRAAIGVVNGPAAADTPVEPWIDALAAAFTKSKDKQVRMEAADALGKLGKAAPQPAIAALKPVLATDKDKRIILAAANALGAIGGAAFPALAEALEHPDSRVREAAMDGICLIPESGSTVARDFLLATLSDPDWKIRAKAAHALGNGAPDDADVLRALTALSTGDEEATVRNAAATALAQLRPKAESASR